MSGDEARLRRGAVPDKGSRLAGPLGEIGVVSGEQRGGGARGVEEGGRAPGGRGVVEVGADLVGDGVQEWVVAAAAVVVQRSGAGGWDRRGAGSRVGVRMRMGAACGIAGTGRRFVIAPWLVEVVRAGDHPLGAGVAVAVEVVGVIGLALKRLVHLRELLGAPARPVLSRSEARV